VDDVSNTKYTFGATEGKFLTDLGSVQLPPILKTPILNSSSHTAFISPCNLADMDWSNHKDKDFKFDVYKCDKNAEKCKKVTGEPEIGLKIKADPPGTLILQIKDLETMTDPVVTLTGLMDAANTMKFTTSERAGKVFIDDFLIEDGGTG